MKIYKLIKDDKVVYVGSTTQQYLSRRVSAHRNGNKTAKKDFDSYELIELTDDTSREAYWIKYYDTFYNGLNGTIDGGRSQSKPIRVWNSEFNKTYKSLMDACRALNLSKGKLSAVALGKRIHHKGFKALYIK